MLHIEHITKPFKCFANMHSSVVHTVHVFHFVHVIRIGITSGSEDMLLFFASFLVIQFYSRLLRSISASLWLGLP